MSIMFSRTFFRLGLVRGVVAAIVGSGVGMGLTMLIRLLMGLPAWKAEPASAVGAILGVVVFLAGVGAFTDWWRWGQGQEAAHPKHPDPHTPTWTRYFSFDCNHKVIGVQYAVTSIIVLGVAGIMALLIRMELVEAELTVFETPDAYNTTLGLHGIVMIAAMLVGIAGMSNYLIPIMLGAADMAFPRLNALSYWLVPPAAFLALFSLFTGGFDTGWTGYPPLGVLAPMGAQFFYLGVFFLGFSSILGSLNLIVTILKMRAPGMSMFRMPIFAWTILATSIIQLIATQFIAMAFLMVVAERLLGVGFFDPDKGGNAVLFQHIFWFYSHPVVYVFVLPGFGIISELLPVFARKPLFGYRWVALSSIAIAFVGFLVWAHHMFTTGLGPMLQIVFMFSTLLVAVPTGVKIFSWLATIWGGKLSFETPLLFVLGAIVIFLMGGLTGPFLALVPTDLFLHETYFVVSHFHQTMFGGFIFPFLAATYYWFPKVTGFQYNERLGKSHFWMMIIGFFVQTGAMYRVGLLGMLRRIARYDPLPGLEEGNLMATVGGFMVGASMLIFVANLLTSFRAKVPAPANPWRSRSPEWQIASPPPEENFEAPPLVVGGPYDYGVTDLAGQTTAYIHIGPVDADTTS
jgi:cytochrome c oxidase subunit 1